MEEAPAMVAKASVTEKPAVMEKPVVMEKPQSTAVHQGVRTDKNMRQWFFLGLLNV